MRFALKKRLDSVMVKEIVYVSRELEKCDFVKVILMAFVVSFNGYLSSKWLVQRTPS